jgi:hypothetical protein
MGDKLRAQRPRVTVAETNKKRKAKSDSRMNAQNKER